MIVLLFITVLSLSIRRLHPVEDLQCLLANLPHRQKVQRRELPTIAASQRGLEQKRLLTAIN
ncbi:hypothetical protein ACQ4M3_30350 [Leptolyngbya sp. AN03gr2]|uniref:hypothetical protein n=1 Tax=unclassified Leptolyngbya TaxID=2650499 RepID=UPI003D322C32